MYRNVPKNGRCPQTHIHARSVAEVFRTKDKMADSLTRKITSSGADPQEKGEATPLHFVYELFGSQLDTTTGGRHKYDTRPEEWRSPRAKVAPCIAIFRGPRALSAAKPRYKAGATTAELSEWHPVESRPESAGRTRHLTPARPAEVRPASSLTLPGHYLSAGQDHM